MSSLPNHESLTSPDIVPVDQAPAEVIDLQEYREEQEPDSADQMSIGVNSNSPELVRLHFHDWQKIEAARTSQPAFEALVEEYLGFIRYQAHMYFLNGGTHDDLMQEALFGFYKAVRDYDGVHSSFKSFAELCMKRQLITAIKTANRYKHEALNGYVSFSHTPNNHNGDGDELNLGDSLPDPGRRPDEIVIGNEAFEGLIDVLQNDLSYLEYSVLKMYLEGESYAAMAEALDEDTKSIDNAFQRVKRKVLEYLEFHG
jgi:RNA polymerase sporulation-specific sigma factor